ncbi:MAG: hypothetical protein ABR962_07145 [Candidatus Bathyarchaeia archaeon]|jgi:hypothetical protein
MKKSEAKHEPLVQTNHEGQKPEKMWLVDYFTVKRHSRTLYLPLDPTVIRLHGIEKGDIVKAIILELRKAPRPDEPIREDSESAKTDEGELGD